MNVAIFTFALLTPALASAWDAVGVFHRPEKVVIQINEYAPAERLQSLMGLWGENTENVHSLSDDGSVKIQCSHGTFGITCIFRFLASPSVVIEDRSVKVALPVQTAMDEISFLNSNGDYFRAHVENGVLNITAGKKEI